MEGNIEEPKQTDENGKPITYWGGLEEPKQECLFVPSQNMTSATICANCGNEKFLHTKQETLEEVADKYVDCFQFGIAHPRRVARNAFINGAKWQAQKTNRRSTERKDRNGVEIFEGDFLVDRYEDEGEIHESLFQVVYCPRLMAWAVDTSYAKDGSQIVSIHEFFGDCLEVKNPLPLSRS